MDNKNEKTKKGMPGFVKVLIVLVVIVAVIFGLIAACTKGVDDSIKEAENSYKDVNGKTSFKKGETFENYYIKMTLSEVNMDFKDYSEYAPVKDGYKVVSIKVDVENIGDEDQYIYYLDFNAYVDKVSMEDFYFMDDNYPSLSATISSGKKASGYLFYEIPKDATSFTVEYDASWLDNNNIEFVLN